MSFNAITDIHLSTDGVGQTVVFPGQVPAGQEFDREIEALREAIKEQPRKKMIAIGNTRWRVQPMREGRYALRRMRDKCPDIDELGLPNGIKALLLQSDLKNTGGLVIIFGLTGAGKTTTWSATIAARLRLHGGYCLTIEDPPEDLLEGRHGAAGYCEQIDADDVGGYENAIYAALRCFPAKDASMLAPGEVRDKFTAAEVLRVAVDGHLVFLTYHGKTIPAGLQRLAAQARAAGEDDANELIAASLRLAIHQRFDSSGKLVVQALVPENQTYAHIRNGAYDNLKSCVDRTQTRLR